MGRKFIYDGREFRDPDPNLSVDEVRQYMTDFFPELSNAEVKERKEGDDTIHEFTRRVGTKGEENRCRSCGCTDDNACWDPKAGHPCYWVEADLCSACVGREPA